MKRNYSNPIGFLDILFLTLVGFVFITAVSLLLIKPEQKSEGIKPKAEYVITVTWDDANSNDVDTWMRDPAGNVCYFRDKEIGLMHLDRDDLGEQNDKIYMPDGTVVEFKSNQEMMTIRGIIPGEYILNVHLFAVRDPSPTKVRIRIEKLNPVHLIVFQKEVILTAKWHEITVTRFTMNADGWIINFDDLPMVLVDDTQLQLYTVVQPGGI